MGCSTVFRSPERLLRAALSAALAVAALTADARVAAWAQEPPAPPPADATAPVEDIVAVVESLDGTQSEARDGQSVTVALTSDVLFAFDKADLTGQAHARLRAVAEQLRAESAGGVIKIQGHTDDQGSEGYNDELSRRRAEAVRAALVELLAGEDRTLRAVGYGERRPRVPNVVDGKPSEENRAKNRRVEIVYDLKQ